MRRFWLSAGAILGLWLVGCASRLAIDLVYERGAGAGVAAPAASAAFQCDAPTQRRSGTCDQHLCAKCAVEVGPDRHLCPAHAAERADRSEPAPVQGGLF
jgi:hypothetical protein